MEFTINSKERNELIDINQKIIDIVNKSKVKDGLCNVYVPHATCAVMINENYDPNVCLDIIEFLKDKIPQGRWKHDKVDGNADAHIKAAVIGPSETIPIKDGRLMLGTWQSIMLADFDGPKERKVIVSVVSL